MTVKSPVVFLAFANDMDRHLATLKDESRAVYDALQPLEHANAVTLHREESAEFDELYNDLLAFDGRIVVFHYAGHADGTMLQLEGGNGGAGGIAKLLGQQSSLKLVFLNGCATKDQVKLLHDAGVPAVIATAVKISDTKATKLSTAFYAALVKGQSIFEAFESARGYIEGKFDGGAAVHMSVNRSPNFDFNMHEQQNLQSFEFEWTLYTRQDCEADLEQWRLTHAQQDWVLDLQDANGPICDLQDNPIKIEHQARIRTIDMLTCLNCHLSTSISDENLAQCPLCGSNKVEQQQAQSNIPQLHLPFDIDKQQARAIALAATGLTEADFAQAEQISLHKVHIPFWVFDFETRSHLSAQRGVINDIHADTLTVEWEDVSEDIDLSAVAFMVPGFKGQTGANMATDDWQWALEDVNEMAQFNRSIPFIPFVISAQEGFDQLVEYLSEALADEAAERIGGHQQKNIVLSTRYKEISVRSIFLPHWCAVLNDKVLTHKALSHEVPTHKEQSTSVIINGQTGAIRFSTSPDKPALINQRHTAMNQKNSLNGASGSKTSHWISVFSGIGIGVMVGLLMGLAAPQTDGAKSVVAIFIGAVGVGLAALLGLNDRHFSAAKGLRIGSFGLAVAISALSGIYVRDNNLLSPSVTDRADELRTVFAGLDDQQLIKLLSSTTSKTEADGSVVMRTAALTAQSVLFNASGVDRSVCEKLNNPAYGNFPAARLLQTFRDLDDENTLGWSNLADAVAQEMPDSADDQKAMLLLARDAACGYVPQAQAIRPESSECTGLNKALDVAAIRAIFADSTALRPILSVVDSTFESNKNRTIALSVLKPVLCSASTAMTQ